HVEAQLGAEVVVQVGLGQPRRLGDGAHASALEPMPGELDFGGGDDPLDVLLADAADRAEQIVGSGTGHVAGIPIKGELLLAALRIGAGDVPYHPSSGGRAQVCAGARHFYRKWTLLGPTDPQDAFMIRSMLSKSGYLA